MSQHEDPATEHSPADPAGRAGDQEAAVRTGPEGDPLVGPGDVDPVDHAVDIVAIDGVEGSIPGEWL